MAVTCAIPKSVGVPVGRCRWVIEGRVQGVGYRPFVWRLAAKHRLHGWVRNRGGVVVIEAEGESADLEGFAHDLLHAAPPLAAVARVTATPLDVSRQGGRIDLRSSGSAGDGFRILPSDVEAEGLARARYDLPVDTAVCPACVAELLDPADRRRGHGLINCTDCGPRFSILRALPYDRANTTMAGFGMCPACRREYSNPADRRFHAQPICCPDCGPRLQLVSPAGNAIEEDPIDGAVGRLLSGQVLAIKGLGGFHLAVRADDEAAVARLRGLKKRDAKPFALMVTDLATARRLVRLSPAGEARLTSPAAPIVLAERRPEAPVARGVAPGTHRLGVMLPYTPIQHLLFHEGGQRLPALVMTSGNQSDEPLVTDNAEAVVRLGDLCDAILWHDRPIERGVDDSVLLDAGGDAAEPVFIRRARGYVPQPVGLPVLAPADGLCVGGELKNTVAVVRQGVQGEAVLSQHLGDLTHPKALANFKRAADDLCRLLEIRPAFVACDAHPVYLSTAYARELADRLGVPRVEVQHHHAHAAALMAEHGITGPIVAVVCDGVGYGDDGTAWGGEVLVADLVGYRRVASLRPLRLPGGDAAAKETARCGLGLLYQAYGDGFADLPAAKRLVPDDARRALLARMIRGNISCAESSGAGRVFDGVAALLGLCEFNRHEAQAAMAVEAAAEGAGSSLRMDEEVEWRDGGHFDCRGDRHGRDGRDTGDARDAADRATVRRLDLSRLVRRIVEGVEAGESAGALAALFHEQLARGLAAGAEEAARIAGLTTVGLSGGVFCNALLTRRASVLLAGRGLRVLRHRVVPPNDGGIALGQAAVAAARLSAAGASAGARASAAGDGAGPLRAESRLMRGGL